MIRPPTPDPPSPTVAAERSPQELGPLPGYLLAVLFAVTALLLRYAFDAVLGANVPYLLSFLAVTVTAVLAGFRPALLATLLSAVGVNVLLTEPTFRFDLALPMPDRIALGLFLLAGASISWLGGNRLAAFQQANAAGEALHEREAQLRALTDNLPGAVTYQAERTRGGTTRLLYVSATVGDLLGLSPHEVYADPERLYSLIPPEHRLALQAAEERAVRGGTSYQIEVPMRRPDGGVRWMHLAASLRVLAGGRQVWDGVAFDITERHAAQEALQQLNAALEERVRERTEKLTRSNHELEQFAYIASHDLKSPLRTITSYLQLLALRYHGQFDQKADLYITFSVDAAARMNALIDDLLAYARLGRERRVVRVETGRVLQDVLDNLHGAIQERGAAVHHGDLPPVLADETQLRQVLQNLIGNALKFQPEGRAPEVRLRASRQETVVCFSVADNGIGIAPEYFERIFGVFQRLHRSEQFAGSGVGLAIVKKIVEEHGGRIWVESIPEVGTTFHFTLPAADG